MLEVTQKWSPNKGSRKGHKIDMIVIHIMEGSLAGTDSHFLSSKSGVSAHYGLGAGTEIHQYVSEEDAAWHAGKVVNPTAYIVKQRPGINPNLYSIGIEHEGFVYTPWDSVMYLNSVALVADICKRHNITPDRTHIVGHREIRADKTCPGKWLDLDMYVRDVQRAMEPASSTLHGRLIELERRVRQIEDFLHFKQPS